MKLINRRLKVLRLSLGFSQEAIGAQGFVSAPGWAKIENRTRQPSDKLLQKLVLWLEEDRHVTKQEGAILLEELLALKYMQHASPFIRRLAREFHENLSAAPILALVAKKSVFTAEKRRSKLVRRPVRVR